MKRTAVIEDLGNLSISARYVLQHAESAVSRTSPHSCNKAPLHKERQTGSEYYLFDRKGIVHDRTYIVCFSLQSKQLAPID